ncbi:sn-glycerol-3-phosphate ABC transporter ATP-binding protein UgpC [bacterium]|nr:sn-glycerol-3-phosphate ABC transporter ATP-binding protein UgpC [bacterium]
MARVELRRLVKRFGDTLVIDRCDLTVEDKEFLVLVGPSGCGKSTLLRMIAGLEAATEGEIAIDGARVNDVAPKDRGIAMVFQNYALYPHMRVYDNMAFGLKMRGHDKADIDRRVREAARVLELEPLLARKPSQLSGGQRQRVAMGRAIVRQPKVFLFDEPLSNLDAKLRVQMRLEIKRLHERLATTIIYVTHDQVEAMTLADRIVVMNGGVIQQVGTPMDLYDRPANRFVAGFLGSPGMNFVPVAIERDGSFFFAKNESLALPLAEGVAALSAFEGKQVVLGVRPEDVHLTQREDKPDHAVDVTMRLIEPLGSSVVLFGEVGPHSMAVAAPPGTAARVGVTRTVYVDMSKVLFFDPSTGERIS